MPKGQKKTKGTPELYNEVKKQVSLSLTPTAIVKLDELAKEYKLSRSEFVEQIARGVISYNTNTKNRQEFIFYPKKSISLQEIDKLPEKMGAFLVSDFLNFALISFCVNLKQELKNRDFLEDSDLPKNIKEQNILVWWIECNDHRNMRRVQDELMSQFRASKSYTERFIKNRDKYNFTVVITDDDNLNY